MTPQPNRAPAWTGGVPGGLSTAVIIAAALIIHPGLLALLVLPAAALGYGAGYIAGQRSAQFPSEAPVVEPPVIAPPEIKAPPPAPAPQKWVDEVAVLQRMGGSMEMLQELTQLFAEENERRLVALRTALAQEDALQVSREAHGIKSGLTNFCADSAVALAFHIEKTAKEGTLEGLIHDIDALETALAGVTDQLVAMGKAA